MSQSYRLQDCVDDWMTRDPLMLKSGQTAFDAAKIMDEKSIGCVLVKEEGKKRLFRGREEKLAGILTDTDIVRKVVAKNIKPSEIKVSELMTPSVKTVDYSYSLADTAQVLKDNKIKRLPVMKKGKVVGILTTTDLMYAMLNLERFYHLRDLVDDISEKNPQEDESGAGLKAKDWMVKTVATVNKKENIVAVAQLMEKEQFGSVPVVVGSGFLVGIVTDTDIVRKVVAKQLDPSTVLVEQIMTPAVITAKPDDTIISIAAIMAEHKLKRIPIIEDEKIVGIISVLDIINILLQGNNVSNAQDLIKMLYRGHVGYFR